MKRIFALLLAAGMLAALLAACGGKDSTESQVPGSAPAADPVGGTDTTSIPEPDPDNEPEEPASEAAEPGETPAPDRDLNELYNSLATAAGLEGTIDVTELDLKFSGGISVDNIVEMAAGQSNLGGDSGLVIVLYVANGTADTMLGELEAYRDSLAADDRYEDFADSREATANARVAAYGNYVVYAAVSAETGAEYAAIDAALDTLFAE